MGGGHNRIFVIQRKCVCVYVVVRMCVCECLCVCVCVCVELSGVGLPGQELRRRESSGDGSPLSFPS